MRIIEHFDNGAKYYPDNIAVIDVGSEQPGLSYADAQPVTHAIAGAVAAKGYSEGGHVGVLAPNCTTAFLALLGLFRAQCVWLPINPRNTVPVNADLLTRLMASYYCFTVVLQPKRSSFWSSARALRRSSVWTATAVLVHPWASGQKAHLPALKGAKARWTIPLPSSRPAAQQVNPRALF